MTRRARHAAREPLTTPGAWVTAPVQPDDMSETLFFTREQAAEATNTSVDTIRAAINAGTLRAKRLGEARNAKYLISREALRDWFDQLDDA